MTIDRDRAFLTEMRAISTDSNGREVLVGLTADETDWYFAYCDRRISGAHRGPNYSDDPDRFLALDDEHERARLEVLGAEMQKRTNNPTAH